MRRTIPTVANSDYDKMHTGMHARTLRITRLAPILVLCALPFAAPLAADAQRLYGEFCSVCHGEHGDGNTHARQGLVPPPRDFTSAGLASRLTRERMLQVVADGKPGTAMAGWHGRLSDAEIAAIVDYVRATFMQDGPAAAADRGKTIYATTCSVCHGEQGTGAVWGQTSLNPPPVNFTRADPDRLLTRPRMIASVTHGRPGTAMAAFGTQLSAADIEAVVDYVRATFMNAAAAVHAPAAGDGGIDFDQSMPAGLTGDAATGHAYYLANCVTCHGVAGDGRGPRAYFIFPKPRNFIDPANRARFNRPALFAAVHDGVRGREMPAWSKVLDDQQIADVSEYVFRTFIRPDAGGAE